MEVYLFSKILPKHLHHKISAEQKEQQLVLKKALFVIGGFETFHFGHESLVTPALKAKYHDYELVIVAALNPAALPKADTKNFMQLSARLQHFANFGFQKALLWDINEVQHWAGKNFIHKIVNLAEEYFIVVGKDFKAGRLGQYQAQDLKADFENTLIAPLYEINQARISTKLLKEQLLYGNISFINSLHRSPYLINAKVDAHFKVDFPEEIVKLHSGIYVAYLVVNNRAYPVILQHKFNGEVIIVPLVKTMQLKEGVYFIEIIKEIRKIVAAYQDLITESDYLLVDQHFRKSK